MKPRHLFATLGIAAALVAGCDTKKPEVQTPVAPTVQTYTVPVEPYVPVRDNVVFETREKPTYRTSDFSTDSEEILLARMIFGEARGCDLEEKIAVGYTAINRAHDGKRWNGENVKDAILKPMQYSCFNKNDPNRGKLMDPLSFEPEEFENCLEVSRNILSGMYPDSSKGATHYFNPRAANPSWKRKLEKIGAIRTQSGLSKHEFYREN